MKYEEIATGKVVNLCVNGDSVTYLNILESGPHLDTHASFTRKLSGHDGTYIRTSDLKKGDEVFNWRTWTALSLEELSEVEKQISRTIPPGCLLENFRFEGIPNFSKLPPTSRLVFPNHYGGSQAILAIWEENGPCATVGKRLAEMYDDQKLAKAFVKHAQGKRGVMGFVLSTGEVRKGDQVKVYLPA